MDVADASVYFDDDVVNDGYVGTYLFNAQVSSFDDSQSDGATSRRRILSLGPGLVMPTRRCIDLYGDKWIVGTGTPDGWYGDIVRQHFTMKRVTDFMTLLTPNQLMTGAAGTQVAVHKMFFKDSDDRLNSSEIDTFWNIFISPTEAAAKGTMLKAADGRLYRVRNDYLPVEGLRVLQSDNLDVGALTAITWDTGTFNVLTQATTAGTTALNAVVLENVKFYRFRFASDPILAKGDLALFVPTTITPKQGDTFNMGGKKWRAVTVQAEADAWAVHARLV